MQDKITLPEYPVPTDMWQDLKSEARPIVVYGMGNGADKLFDRLAEYGIKPTDIFASDGFVRGHSFREMRVKSFSEIKAEYPDFVILLSFASNRPEVLEMLYDIDDKYDMYVPDMPVAGAQEYFDLEFYNTHYEEISRAYAALADARSREVYAAVVNYKLTGRIAYLRLAAASKSELYSLFPTDTIQSIVDVGAYNGDTIREAIEFFPNLKSAVAIEPDVKTYKRLLRYLSGEDRISVVPYNAAAWSKSEAGVFKSSGNRNSSVTSTSSFEHKMTEVPLITIDSLALSPDYIKYDVEGAEMEALIGSDEVIARARPALLVSLYHRSRDLFEIINYLHDKYPFYKLSLCRLECLPAWELDLILTT